ncbi:MAG: hypothetical protein AAB652_00400 [Patescibacteria group bacterium]
MGKNKEKHYFLTGFTVIELLVVVGITASLASLLVVYGGSARQFNTISVEQAKIGQVILRAKSLAVATFNQPPVPCGYGVAFNAVSSTYTLFSYDVYVGNKKDCGTINVIHTNNPQPSDCGPGFDPSSPPPRCYIEIETHALNSGLKFDSAGNTDAMDFVFFRPPDPRTYLFPDPPRISEKRVYLKTLDGGVSRVVTVNLAGQISFQ